MLLMLMMGIVGATSSDLSFEFNPGYEDLRTGPSSPSLDELKQRLRDSIVVDKKAPGLKTFIDEQKSLHDLYVIMKEFRIGDFVQAPPKTEDDSDSGHDSGHDSADDRGPSKTFSSTGRGATTGQQTSTSDPLHPDRLVATVMNSKRFLDFRQNTLIDLEEELKDHKDTLVEILKDQFATPAQVISYKPSKKVKPAQQYWISKYYRLVGAGDSPELREVKKHLDLFEAGKALLDAEKYDVVERMEFVQRNLDQAQRDLDAAQRAGKAVPAAVAAEHQNALLAYQLLKKELEDAELENKSLVQERAKIETVREIRQGAALLGKISNMKKNAAIPIDEMQQIERLTRLLPEEDLSKDDRDAVAAEIESTGSFSMPGKATDTFKSLAARVSRDLLSKYPERPPFDEAKLQVYQPGQAKSADFLSQKLAAAEKRLDDATQALDKARDDLKTDTTKQEAEVERLTKELQYLDELYRSELFDTPPSTPRSGHPEGSVAKA